MSTQRLTAFSGWLLAFVALLASKWWTLRVPASWDASWTVFAGGSTLAENGFDLIALIQSPSFREYGVGTHASSPVTWLTGGMIELLGTGDRLLPTLHVVHLMLGALALQQIFRYARGIWGWVPSVLVVVTIALVPTLNAQFNSMYLEIPQLAATMLAINAFLRGDLSRSAAWAAVGTLVKGSGILVPLAIGATVLSRERTRAGLAQVGRLVVPSLAVLAVLMAIRPDIGFDDRVALNFLRGSFAGLLGTPDVALLMGLVLLFVASALRSAQLPEGERTRLILASWMIGGFLAFYLLLPLARFPFVMLPRYLGLIIPVTVVGVGIALGRVFGPHLLRIGWVVLLVASIANHDGRFYLEPSLNNTVYQEHANGNAQLLMLIQDGFAELEGTVGTPILLDRNQWFRATYPASGYVTQPLANILKLDGFRRDGRFDDLPRAFAVLDSEATGPDIPLLREQLAEDPTWEAEITVLKRDRFEISIIRYTKLEA